MTKQELMALGLNEEAADKVLKEHVPYDRFKQVNDDKKALEGQLTERDKAITDLSAKVKAGEGAEKSIADLQEQLKQKDTAVLAARKDAAVQVALTQAKAKNAKAVMALLDADKLELQEDGSVKGLKEALEGLQKSDAYLFEPAKAAASQSSGFNPSTTTGGGTPPPATLQDAIQAGLEAQMKG